MRNEEHALKFIEWLLLVVVLACSFMAGFTAGQKDEQKKQLTKHSYTNWNGMFREDKEP